MPEVIQGNATVVVPTKGAGTHIVIVATTNATPVVIETFGAHGFYSGDSIEVEGTGIATVDGLWVVTVLTSTTFELNGSTAPGSASILGYCINYEVQPALQVPLPGEPASAVTSIPPLQGLANTEPWHYRNAGKFRLYNIYAGAPRRAPAVSPSIGAYPSPWTFISSVTAADTFVYGSGVSLDFLLSGGLGSGAAPIVGPNDVLDVTFAFTSTQTAGSAGYCAYGIAAWQPLAPISYIPISSTTSANPVQVTTAVAHGMVTGSQAAIISSSVNALNDMWTITSTGTNTLTLNGSTSAIPASGASGFIVALTQSVVLGPTNWPLAPVAAAAAFTPMTVSGMLGSPVSGPSPVTPACPMWLGLIATPGSPSTIAEVELTGPMLVKVYHYRAN